MTITLLQSVPSTHSGAMAPFLGSLTSAGRCGPQLDASDRLRPPPESANEKGPEMTYPPQPPAFGHPAHPAPLPQATPAAPGTPTAMIGGARAHHPGYGQGLVRGGTPARFSPSLHRPRRRRADRATSGSGGKAPSGSVEAPGTSRRTQTSPCGADPSERRTSHAHPRGKHPAGRAGGTGCVIRAVRTGRPVARPAPATGPAATVPVRRRISALIRGSRRSWTWHRGSKRRQYS